MQNRLVKACRQGTLCVRRFLASEEGPTAVEYAVMLAVIIIGAIGAVLTTGNVQQALFFDVADEVNSAAQGN